MRRRKTRAAKAIPLIRGRSSLTRRHRPKVRTRKWAKSIKVKECWIGGSRSRSMATLLPSFQKLKDVIERTFTVQPGFVLERETLFAGIDEDTEPVNDERANYLWDGKSKLAFYKAKSYSDGSSVGLEDISLQVASAPYVRCKILVNKKTWNQSHRFRCLYSIITQHGNRNCMNDNFSAIFSATRNSSGGLQACLVFVGKYSRKHLQVMTVATDKFIVWLDSI